MFENNDKKVVATNDEINKVLTAVAEDPKVPWQPTSVVKIPGAYNVYALGTTGDVTLLAWIHRDGRVTVRYNCW